MKRKCVYTNDAKAVSSLLSISGGDSNSLTKHLIVLDKYFLGTPAGHLYFTI